MRDAQVYAVRLFDQAMASPDKQEALVLAAAMLAESLGHPHTAKRFRETVVRTVNGQRRTLDTRRRPKD